MAKRKERPQMKEGHTFTKVYKGKKYTMKTVKDGGRIRYKVSNILSNTPTAAAQRITQNSVNGWVFWGIDKKPAYHQKKSIK
jgi:hypothetical protein